VPSVTRLSYTPVKGLALVHPGEIFLGPDGLAENRLFYVIAEDGRRYELRRDGRLALVGASYDPRAEELALRFPDGSVTKAPVEVDGSVATDFYGRPVSGRLVVGPLSEALSTFLGRQVRLVKTVRPGTALDSERGTVSLVSEASVSELARTASLPGVDERRFRMLIALDGCRAHEEDAWVGREVRVGEAVVHVLKQIVRCAATTYSPDTGRRDLDTLRLIQAYRGTRGGKDVEFGVEAEVVTPGRVAAGDHCEPV
jgi:uncharacterized protein YcbX